MKFIIAGTGPEEHNLQAMIDDLPSNAHIEMLGETNNDTVMELMKEADVFVLPCQITQSGDRDGIPVVLIEAMALGRCVISGDLITIRELIQHNHSGILIPPGDRDSLAKELIKLANDRERVDKLGIAARKRIEEEFDLTLNMERIKTTLHNYGLA
jgi:glycosyltransferase involved in cell wall biosynthesis